MAVTERQRHELFKWFEEQMGEERASTMIELMPPTGFAELATKQDLAERGYRAAAQRKAMNMAAVAATTVAWLARSQVMKLLVSDPTSRASNSARSCLVASSANPVGGISSIIVAARSWPIRSSNQRKSW